MAKKQPQPASAVDSYYDQVKRQVEEMGFLFGEIAASLGFTASTVWRWKKGDIEMTKTNANFILSCAEERQKRKRKK